MAQTNAFFRAINFVNGALKGLKPGQHALNFCLVFRVKVSFSLAVFVSFSAHLENTHPEVCDLLGLLHSHAKGLSVLYASN